MANDKVSQFTDGLEIQSGDYVSAIRTLDGGVTWSNIRLSIAALAGLRLNSSESGSAYTLALLDQNTLVDITNSSGASVTVPTNASVAFPIGTEIRLRNNNSGSYQIQIVAASGVTINSKGGLLKSLSTQYSLLTLLKLGTNTWQLSGDVSA